MELVSYIVPVYNAESYIEKCINSICKQSYQNFEIILIDDGSQDGSWQILKELALHDERIQIFTQENHGVSYTRNRGIRLAKGNYIQFVDADDYIDSRMTECMIEMMQEEELDLVLCMFQYKNCKDGKVMDSFSGQVDEVLVKYFVPLMKNSLLQGPCNKIYKTEIIRSNGIAFPESYAKLEDSIFNAQYINKIRRMGFVPEAFYFYDNTNQVSLSKRLNVQEIEAMFCFYQTLLEAGSVLEDYRRIILGYAIEQIEVLYRVSWIKYRSDRIAYRQLWDAYQDSLFRENRMALLKPYVKNVSVRYRWFWISIVRNRYYLTVMYCWAIEGLKKTYSIFQKAK